VTGNYGDSALNYWNSTTAHVDGLPVRATSIRARIVCDMMPRRRGESIDSTVTVVLRCHRRSRRTLRLCGNTWHTLRPGGPGRPAIARRVAADWHDGQNSASRRPQISGLSPAIPFRQEGRSRVVTNAEMGCGGRESVGAQVRPQGGLNLVSDCRRARRTTFERTAKPCGPDTRCWCQVGGGYSSPTGVEQPQHPPTTVTRRIRRRGERGISRKAIAQGMPECFR
jgi:hypothetical protein